ncbi:MAG: HAD-IA family hydrolase [Acidimicrobiales bacterium]|nr:HAD-IA family hydrolase [Acidimicrobiales bacterium]
MALGVPDSIKAFLFDMDGVITRTATVHAAAWKQAFDELLQGRSKQTGEPFRPFDPVEDYDRYVDGREREDGVREFVASRQITLPEGRPGDRPGTPTVCGIANRKNAILLDKLAHERVGVFDDTVAYVGAVRGLGLPRAVVSASANAAQVLISAGVADLFDARIDGIVAAEKHLRGKPAPDMFWAGAEALGVPPGQAVVFEDALAGVAAGRAGQFGFVVGVDRVGQAEALKDQGADVVVSDVRELLAQP